MKQLRITILLVNIMLCLHGCATQRAVHTSQNCDLNKISNSKGEKKAGYMQKSLDNWLKNDWMPTLKNDKKIQKKYLKNKKNNFTLQEYVDKASAYMKAKPADYEHSNVKKLKSLPVIGK
jgi:hypothetical protein